jgi:RNA polymerase sigma-70 factor (ECF subfamily)
MHAGTVKRSGEPGQSRNPAFPTARVSARGQTFAAGVETVYRYFWSRVGNREDAEDLTAQVVRSAGHLLPDVRATAEMSELLTAACRGTLDAYLSRRGTDADKPRERRGRTLSHHPRSPAELLAALPARYREVLELCLLRGCSSDEAAEQLSIPVNEVGDLVRDALACAASLP